MGVVLQELVLVEQLLRFLRLWRRFLGHVDLHDESLAFLLAVQLLFALLDVCVFFAIILNLFVIFLPLRDSLRKLIEHRVQTHYLVRVQRLLLLWLDRCRLRCFLGLRQLDALRRLTINVDKFEIRIFPKHPAIIARAVRAQRRLRLDLVAITLSQGLSDLVTAARFHVTLDELHLAPDLVFVAFVGDLLSHLTVQV